MAAAAAVSIAAGGQATIRPKAPSPTVKVLPVPDFHGSYAIWGSTGSDHFGHIWIGVTTNDAGTGSAHLFELDPPAATFTDRGSVVQELERLKLRRPNETQMKIHSRIVEAEDGYLYFSSMDESGEAEDGSRLPTWGGHLWRRNPESGVWEHLAQTPEALIAVATGGPYVYALGYFNHVLYQFDTRTKKLQSVTVGSVGGHVSRNFFVDRRGHAFVTRVTQDRFKISASLVEFDPSLTEVGQTRLKNYFEKGLADSHGIVAVQSGADGSWYFATGAGRLYQMVPVESGPSAINDLGWFHPRGSRYVASMFRDERSGALYGVAMEGNYGGQTFDWVRKVPGGVATAAPFPYGDRPFPSSALVYGSMSHDAAGRFYVVGTMSYKPFVLQVTPAAE